VAFARRACPGVSTFGNTGRGIEGRKARSSSGTGPGISNAGLVLVMSHTITQDVLKALEDHVLWLSAFLVVVATL
jgi:hypothetical protein